jgi:DNA primase
MEITEIKSQLTIAQVLDHYGLKANQSKMLCCPFHNDKTPSMQVYPETNTVHCFSSNCKLHGKAVDVIDFIMYHEGITKHEAIMKAKELIGYSEPSQPFEKLFKVFQSILKKNDKAQGYLKERNIAKAEVGFNDGTWESLKQCVIFPLKSKQNKTVSLYGRSIHNNTDSKHYYTKNRKGLYPNYPKADTKQLILTEAIIDAATLQLSGLKTNYSILSCYGTNGFTNEHEQAIKELKQLEEIIIFFDGDEAGREGSKRIADKLHQLKPEIKISSVNTPEGEDINSLAQSHGPEIFTHLIEKRTAFIFSTETKAVNQQRITNNQFDTSNPHKLIYRTLSANYYIKGGLRNEADSMRVSLDIEHPQNKRKSRSKLDLYEDKQVEKIAREAAEKLQLRADLIQLDLELLTELLEQLREKQSTPKETQPENKINPLYEKQAMDFLSKPNLMKRWNDLIGRAGVVGEENNRIFLMVIATTHKMPDPLHALIQGSSGSGKTHLMAKIFTFVPADDKKNFTRITEGNLYNWGEYALCHKFICIEDLDGLKEEALFALRELISKGVIISATSVKDDNGNVSAMERIVYGPIASMSCTTKGEIYEDNMGRCFIIAVDESHAQTLRIIEYQNKRAAGQIDEQKEKQCAEFIQTLVAMLKSHEVVNPYADKVHLPEEAHKIRRLNGLYQAFVKAVTLMHQYQRKKDARGRLISEKEDLQIAAEIMFESIVLKVDELDGSLRQFYERLKTYVKTKGNGHHESYEFGQREVRQALNVSKTQLHRYLNDLSQLEYIRQSGGHINKGFNYKILYWDNIQALRAKVKRHLQGQLDQLELVTA